ncbi:MAG: type 12 methyltransferase [Puniceicoccaceae bacterium 5H]|nr:MAG: type 12 methyltransferase [Puniceicoccaceae bacterium 5H]
MEADALAKMHAQEANHWWFVARRRIIARILRHAKLPGQARILEAGCGTGGNLEMLTRFGEVKAFELEDGARQVATNLGRAQEILPGRLPDEVPVACEQFDAVVAFDVLEHIEDGQGAIKTLTERVKPGGVFCLAVPAFMSMWSYHDTWNHHFRRYEAPVMPSRLQAAGLVPECYTYFNTALFPLIALIRRLKNQQAKPGDDLAPPPAPVNMLLKQLIGSESWFMPRVRFPFGLSLLVLARRPLNVSGSKAA